MMPESCPVVVTVKPEYAPVPAFTLAVPGVLN